MSETRRIKYLRATTPFSIDFIKDKFTIDESLDRDATADGLKSIVSRPDVYIAIALDEDLNEAVMFIVAIAYPNQKVVNLIQVWADPKLEGRTVQDRLFLRTCLWAESIGRIQLRAECDRSSDALYRRWRFRERSKIVAFDIGDDLASTLFDNSKEEKEDKVENKKKSKDEEKVEPKAKLISETPVEPKVDKGKENV